MADMKQDLLGLQFSQSFPIQGMQEAICPHAPPPLHGLSCGTAGGPVQRQPV